MLHQLVELVNLYGFAGALQAGDQIVEYSALGSERSITKRFHFSMDVEKKCFVRRPVDPLSDPRASPALVFWFGFFLFVCSSIGCSLWFFFISCDT